jgi:DNA replicative helicase MCM subunit Mcm2 (Cdc46/Mcm family)
LEATQVLIDYFKKLRQNPNTLKIISPRDYETLLRIIKAVARIKLSPIANKNHAEITKKIFNECLSTWMIKLRPDRVDTLEMNDNT